VNPPAMAMPAMNEPMALPTETMCPPTIPAENNEVVCPQPLAYSSPKSCSVPTSSNALDINKRRLHLPHVAFSTEVGAGVIV